MDNTTLKAFRALEIILFLAWSVSVFMGWMR
jgi:hypothetical protein